MAVIKSGVTTDQLTVDATSKAARTTLYNTDGNIVGKNTIPLVTAPILQTLYGVYVAHIGLQALQATAMSATMGFFWLMVPGGATKNVRIRRLEFDSIIDTATKVLATTRITVERVTFSAGTPTTQWAACKADSNDQNAVALIGLSSAGVTYVAGATAYGFIAPTLLNTAAGIFGMQGELREWEPEAAGMITLAPGEGIVIRQPDAGVTGEFRKFTLNFAWEEYTLL